MNIQDLHFFSSDRTISSEIFSEMNVGCLRFLSMCLLYISYIYTPSVPNYSLFFAFLDTFILLCVHCLGISIYPDLCVYRGWILIHYLKK
jgi:hypothetical protein